MYVPRIRNKIARVVHRESDISHADAPAHIEYQPMPASHLTLQCLYVSATSGGDAVLTAVCLSVCLSVSLFVSRITQKVMDDFRGNWETDCRLWIRKELIIF